MKNLSDLTNREIDALVAEKVFGKKRSQIYLHDGKTFNPIMPRYMTRVDDCWLIIEELKSRGAFVEVRWCDEWQVDITNYQGNAYLASDCVMRCICLAALKAMGGGSDCT